MAGRIELVRPGAEAEEALVASIRRAQSGDALASVSVVVRSPMVSFDLRRRLAERGAFAGTRFTPLSRLIELLGPPDDRVGGEERRPLTETALGAAVRVALRSGPGVLAGVIDHPATEDSLVQTYRLLRPLEPADRKHIASMSSRAADVVRIIEAAREALEAGWYDREDLARSAAARIERGEVDLEDVGPVILHLPDPLGAAQASFLEVLSRHTDVTVLAGIVGDEAGDRAPRALVEELGRHGFELTEAPATTPCRPSIGRVVGLPDLEEEVRMAVRLLVAHAEQGKPLGRTALAFPGSPAQSAYVGVIEEMLAGAGIPWTGPAMTTLADTGPGRVVIGLVQMLVTDEAAFERSSVIRWLSSPSLTPACGLFAGLSSLTNDGDGGPRPTLPVGAFDRCSRAAGVVTGSEEWASRLGAYARRRFERSTSGASVSGSTAEDLRRVIARLARLGSGLRRAGSWEEVATWAAEVVDTVVEPGDDQDRLSDAVGELAYLGALEELCSPVALADAGGLSGPGRWEVQLLSAFAAALSSQAGSHGRFGAGPVVGSIAALAGIRTDLLIVLGAGEGVLPARTPDDPLVTEIEREAVRVLAERERVEDRDRRTTLTLLAGADTSVVTYPRVARGASRPAYPSRWLAGDLFSGDPEEVASFSAAVTSVAAGALSPADASDLELALLKRGLDTGRAVEDLVVAELGDLLRRLSAERERGGRGISRFGGRVGPLREGTAVFTEVMSATRMESLASCPLQFMLDRIAHVEILEAPERRHMIEAKDRGSLIHSVLEDFVEATVIGNDSFHGWDDDESVAILHQIAERHFEDYESQGLTGKPVYWRMARSRTLSDLERFVAIESRRLQEGGGTPVRTEMAFGFGDVPPVVIDARGRNMTFRGKIDRIDIEPGPVVRVIDYKSGKANYFAGIEKDPLDGGRHLQLPIYAKAARTLVPEEGASVIAEFRFCSSEGGFKALPVELTPALDAELDRVLGVLGDTIERGNFPPRPGNGDEWQPANCRRCDYESMCRLDRVSLWQRATEDETMSEYVELVAKQKATP
ncbi:MAG: PD-(D/E)XK nuclease family protein [Acidimicrobiales bacterium]